MSLTATFEYQKHATVDANTLSISGSFTSEILNLTIDIGTPNRGRLITSRVGDVHGVFTKEAGLLEIIGTAAEINAVLATMKYQGDSTGYFLTVPASVTLANGSTTVESGTVTFEPEAPPYYAPVTWVSTPATQTVGEVEAVVQTVGIDEIAKVSLPRVNDTSTVMLSCTIETIDPVSFATTNSNAYGEFLVPEAGNERGIWESGRLSFYATRGAVNTFLSSIRYKPNGSAEGLFKVTVSDERPSQPATTYLYYHADAPALSGVPSTMTIDEDKVTPTTLGNVSIVPPTVGTYTITLRVENSAHVTISASPTGGVTPSWNADTRTLTIIGNNVTALNSVLSSCKFVAGSNWDQDFTITTSISNTKLMPPTTYTTIVDVAPSADPHTISFGPTNTQIWTKDTIHDFVGLVAFSDVDTGQELNVSLALSETGLGTLSSVAGGSWNSSTKTFSCSGTIAAVNAILAGLVYTPPAGFNTSFFITVTGSDPVTGLNVTGTIYMDSIPVQNVAITSWDDVTLTSANAVILSNASATPDGTYIYNAEVSFDGTMNPSFFDLKCDNTALLTSAAYSKDDSSQGKMTLIGSKANVTNALTNMKLVARSKSNWLSGSVPITVKLTTTPAYIDRTDQIATVTFPGFTTTPPTATNYSGSRTYLKNTTFSFSPTISVSDADSSELIGVLIYATAYGSSSNPISNPGTISSTGGTVTALTPRPLQAVSGVIPPYGVPPFAASLLLQNSSYGVSGSNYYHWTIVGTVSQVNTVLGGLRYTPETNFTSSFNLWFYFTEREPTTSVAGNMAFTCSNP